MLSPLQSHSKRKTVGRPSIFTHNEVCTCTPYLFCLLQFAASCICINKGHKNLSCRVDVKLLQFFIILQDSILISNSTIDTSNLKLKNFIKKYGWA